MVVVWVMSFGFFLGKIVIYRWVSHIVYVAKSRGIGCRKLILRCDEVCAHTSHIHLLGMMVWVVAWPIWSYICVL